MKMSINTESSALSISKSIDSLETTPSVMHRIVFELVDTAQWYAIMREARTLYGKNWRSQSHVKRKLDRNSWNKASIPVWFEVPDLNFATWVAVKHSVIVNRVAGK